MNIQSTSHRSQNSATHTQNNYYSRTPQHQPAVLAHLAGSATFVYVPARMGPQCAIKGSVMLQSLVRGSMGSPNQYHHLPMQKLF